LSKVLVTGGASGIGKAAVQKLLSDGFSVVATYHRLQPPFEDYDLTWIRANLSDPSDREKLCSEVSSDARLSGVVNVAGINVIQTAGSVTPDAVSSLWEVNFFAAYEICRRLAPSLGHGDTGRIVNVASIWAEKGKPGRSNYAASKAALVGMTRALAVELGPAKVLVNSVSPGFTLTELTSRSLSEKDVSEISERIPLGRLAQPSEIADVIAFIVGQNNTYITGQNIVVDGGFSVS